MSVPTLNELTRDPKICPRTLARRGAMRCPILLSIVLAGLVICIKGRADSNTVVVGGIEFVKIQAGTFWMGCPSAPPKPWAVESCDSPVRRIGLSPFSIGKYPITVEQFCRFLRARPAEASLLDSALVGAQVDLTTPTNIVPRRGLDMKPMQGVTYTGAVAFCEWLSDSTKLPCRLPTEAEWEFTARGTSGRTYPWGEAILKVAVYNDSVGQNPEMGTPEGVQDLNGPVVQWCLDAFDCGYSSTATPVDPLRILGDGRHVVRGGGKMRYGREERYFFPPGWMRFASHGPTRESPRKGFRVVISDKTFIGWRSGWRE